MLKKTVSVFLAIILICAAVPFCAVSVSAAESGEAVGNDYPVLTLDTPYRVDITTGGMEVLLQFTPTESGTYIFHSYDSYDSYGVLYDENMNNIAWDDSSYNDWDFLIKKPLEAGKTYYLKAGDYYEPVPFNVIVSKEPESATSITLSCGEAQTITKGSSFPISVDFHPEFAPSEAVTWATTDGSVATVSENGNVTAVGTGEATITATSAKGLTASCVVTVSGDAPVLTLDVPYTVNITTGGMEVLFKFTPAESGTYIFHSYDSYDSYGGLYDENMNNIAWDDSSYNDWDFLIKKPLEAGKTYYLKAGDYYEPVPFNVIVSKEPESVTSITLSCGDAQTITKGSSFPISVDFHPEFAPSEAITWTTTDGSVATVSENGNVTAVGTGVATITATSAKGLTASCVITVSGDTPALTLDTPYRVNITTGGMEVLLQFTPAESGTYTFHSYNSYDSYGGLYDENMNGITWDDSSYNDWDFLIKNPLEAGKTYYLKVGDYYNEPVSFDVIVNKDPEAATSITLSCGETRTLSKGSSFDVSVAFHPKFAPSEAITWTTTDDSVATVSESGHVTAVGTGVATITATSANGLTASCVITVPPVYVRGDATGDGVVTIDDATEIQRYLAEFDFDDTTRLLQFGDVTGDNKITIADVTAIQRYLADIENINNIGQRIG